MKEIQVSICCLVYNHEKYLRQCLDGFVMQKDVTFEVLIHDDASTDHSVGIIREYEAKYPGIFKPIYQTENQYSKGIAISSTYQYPRAKGKYVAICEGDDFWTDPYKLKKQVQAMEENPDCSACFHRVQCVEEDGTSTNQSYPAREMQTQKIVSQDYFNSFQQYGHQFQTSSHFYRAGEIKKYGENKPHFAQIADVGDVPLLLYFGTIGNFYYYQDTMSCYRMNSIGSWSSRMLEASKEKAILHYERMTDVYREFEKFTNYTVSMEKRIIDQKAFIALLKNDYPAANRIICKNQQYFSRQMRLSVWLHAHFPKLSKVLERIKHGKK